MSFIEKITAAIKNPKNAMKNISDQPMIEEAVMIVGIYAVLGALAAYVQASKIIFVFEGFENMPPSIQSITMVLQVVGALVGPFLTWSIGTGIIHLISMALGGEGKFYPQMMTAVGYSFIPMLFGSIISLALLLLMEPMTITISATNQAAAEEFYKNPYIFASSVIGAVMLIWTSIILFFGVQSAQRLTPAKSAIVAGIPLVIGVISLVWSIWNLGIL
ncbi:Yip1 domain [Candidatus Methanoperedens nitroreducens]|uniref:Yip1 domain n=1 Tax=Candidatus Methanoperedens nitratireducens TaxID=1392998 RepID=A0A062V590_9EURY|nr:Yip1 family protein [Candidatus Methanoperedens nitroreducens]KCZ71778.1 Yip1 domain [Candidatus Methanoperedens nitroreducens]MDJ1422248.1 Yip1 family protein [Candidatus Methanoperedens sp.]